jgi:hypothetical protein
MAQRRGTRIEELLDTIQKHAKRPDQLVQYISASVDPHRQIAAECLVYLADQYRVAEDTLLHSLVLLDRYISAATLTIEDSNKKTMISVAAACFMLSMKLREVSHPAVEDLSRITSCTTTDLLNSEEAILRSLDWDIISVSGSSLILFQSSK